MFCRARTFTAAIAISAVVLSGCAEKAPFADQDSVTEGSQDYTAARSEPNPSPMYPQYGNTDIDVLHYQLDLDYEPDETKLSGTVTLTIRPVNDAANLTLDFSDVMNIDAVTVDDENADFTHTDYKLVVNTAMSADDETQVAVTYSGTPAKMPAPAQRSDMASGIGATVGPDGALWTFQQPFGALTWYPSNDTPWDEAFYDFEISVPDGYAGVASGTLISDDNNTYVWSSSDPVATYLATIAVDRYTMAEDTGPNGVPITTWTKTRSDMESVFAQTSSVLEWLEAKYGPYPFETAGVVEVGGQSAMETQQMITFSGTPIVDEEHATAETGVLVHEMVHQWFGDSVTPQGWDALWLSEGVATYTEQMWLLDQGGPNMTESQLVSSWEQEDALLRNEFGPPGDPAPEAFASSNSYVCPALMLYNLRDEIGGKDAVYEFLAAWVKEHRNQTVTREDFIEFANDYTGKDLTSFFNEWLDSPTTPK